MSIGTNFGFFFPNDEFNNIMGIAIRPFTRFYAMNSERWSVFFESGAGFIYFIDNFPKPTDHDPRNGTFWNGNTRYGIGMKYKLNDKTGLFMVLGHTHVSNGNIKGVERNPSHYSNGFIMGFSYIP